MYWIEFLISSTIIILAGIRLTIYADKLSDELHLGKVWIGIVLLGLVTSLPEAITSLVAIISLHANDLAIGNLLGSNNFNPMLIVVMDVLYRRGSVTNAVQPMQSHRVSARFAILLVFLVIADIQLNILFPALHLGSLSMGSVMIAFLYFIGMRQLARLSTGENVISTTEGPFGAKKVGLVRIWLELLISAALVIAGAMVLARSADMIAVQTGLGRTFVGSIFLACVTSLPEMVVSLSALRLGSLDLAIGNIFGSNMTNMFIVFVCGMFNPARPILGTVSPTHTATGVLSILLTFIAVKGIFTRDKKTILGLGWDSVIMTIFFVIGTAVLYQLRLV